MRLGTIVCLSLLMALALGGINTPSGATTTGQSSPQNYVCDKAYTWNQQICVACLQVAHGTCTCSNYGECANLICDDKYYQIGQTCLSHPDSNCLNGGLASDGSTIVCYTCASSYTQIGGICVQNNLCQNFDLTTGLCTKCATSYFNAMMVLTPALFPTVQSLSLTYAYNTYYQNIQQCVSCVTGCDNCLSASTCKTCAPSYYLTSANICATCVSITTNCATCADSTGACSACSSGYYLSQDGKTCYSCSDTTKTNNLVGIAQCATCTVSGTGSNASLTCNSCSAGYTLSSNACNTCTGYPTTCSGCDSNGVCNSCSNVSGSVVLYKSSCTTCSNCMPGSCAVNSDSTGVVCSKCNDLYYLNTSGGCVPCSNTTGFLRCTYTNSKVIATQCQNGYFLVNGGCVSAATTNTCSLLVVPSDGTTANSAQCNTCWPGYSQSGSTCFTCNNCTSSTNCTQSTTNANQTVCSSCIAHYYFDSTQSVCTACIANCDSCTGPAIGDCQSCIAGYFKTSTACTACTTQTSTTTATTCAVCADATTCTTCLPGYYVSSGKCLSCQIGCSQCTNSGNLCTSCVTGYYIQNGGCVQIQSNCLSISTTNNGNTVSITQANQTNGCTMCQYGFYLTSGWLTQQSSTTQVTDQVCLQCIVPESGFVCRANPIQVTQAQVPGIAATTITTSNYFKYALALQTQGVARLTAPTCRQGYFWNTQTCMPCVAINNGICTACSNFTDCQTFICNSGYFQLTYNNTSSCVVLPTGCTTLTYSTAEVALACTACSAGYTLVGNICILNNSCLTISQTNGSCTECQAGYYFNWSFSFQNVINAKSSPANNANYYNYFAQFCSKCYTGCAVCTSAYTCTSCTTGYYWSQSTVTTVYTQPQTQNVFIASNSNTQSNGASGQCLTCPSYCISCTSGTSCTTCATAYYYDSTATTPDTLCKPCGISQCTSCPGGTCTQCASPYTLSGNSCVQTLCNQPCATCGSDANTCATCQPYYIITGTTCTACPSYCNSCNILSGTNDTTTCSQCQDGYYMVQQTNNQVTCSPCSSAGTGFLRCNGALENTNQSGVIPFQCNDNYYLSNNACYAVQSSPTCSTIQGTSSSACATCLPSLTANGTNCALCSTSISNCTTCTANNNNTGYVCSACAIGYVLNTATNTCDKCPGGCQVCTVSGSSLPYTYACSTCYAGNYKNTVTGLCVGCPPSCTTCDSKLTCTTCANGYYLKQSTVLFTTFSATAASQYTFKPCYPCQTGCATCTGPNGNVCTTCQTGYVLQSSGCVTLSNANCYTYDSNGCTSCQAGFFLDASRVCQECVSPYTNFVCGLKSVTPTPTPTPGPTPGPTPVVAPAIGVNPVQSYGYLLGLLIMVILQ